MHALQLLSAIASLGLLSSAAAGPFECGGKAPREDAAAWWPKEYKTAVCCNFFRGPLIYPPTMQRGFDCVAARTLDSAKFGSATGMSFCEPNPRQPNPGCCEKIYEEDGNTAYKCVEMRPFMRDPYDSSDELERDHGIKIQIEMNK